MKRIILSILAVAAAGGLAAAQVASDSTDVSTTQATTYTVSADATLTLTLGTASTSTLSYSSNDGVSHTISATASAWVGPAGVTVFPVLSADGNSLRDSANGAPLAAPVLVTAAANTSSSHDVSVLAANTSGAGLQGGTYTSTVSYTMN